MQEASENIAASSAESKFLLEYLRDRDVNCPLCGYNLRNLTSPRCPECGQIVKITVALAEPYLKAWILLMATTCAGSGIGVLLMMLAISKGNIEKDLFEVCITSWGMIPMAALSLALRRRFLRARKEAQWIFAGGAALLLTSVLLVCWSALR